MRRGASVEIFSAGKTKEGVPVHCLRVEVVGMGGRGYRIEEIDTFENLISILEDLKDVAGRVIDATCSEGLTRARRVFLSTITEDK